MTVWTVNAPPGAPGAPGRSSGVLARDPRFLIMGFLIIAASVFVIRDTLGLSLVLLYVLVLHLLSGLPLSSIGKTAKGGVVFVLFIVGVNSLLVEGRPLIPAIPFVSREGISSGVHASVRVLVLCFGMVVFLSVTTAEDIAKGISALVAPFSRKWSRRAALYCFLSVGFLPLFTDELKRIAVAQEFRGGGFRGGLFKKIRGVRLLIVPIIVSAIHRSEQLAMIVEIRGIRSRISGILVPEKVSAGDFLFVVTTAAVIAAAMLVFRG